MPCLKITNYGVLSPGQINTTNRITVLTEKLPQENGDVPGCALLPLRARSPSHLTRLDCIPLCYLANVTNYKAPEHVNTQLLYFTMLLHTILIHIFPIGDNTRTIKNLVTLLLCVI
jgi:hypothetical protein